MYSHGGIFLVNVSWVRTEWLSPCWRRDANPIEVVIAHARLPRVVDREESVLHRRVGTRDAGNLTPRARVACFSPKIRKRLSHRPGPWYCSAKHVISSRLFFFPTTFGFGDMLDGSHSWIWRSDSNRFPFTLFNTLEPGLG